MKTKILLRRSSIGAALVALLLVSATAGDPSAVELLSLAPVLDSSDPNCQSLEIVGSTGNDQEPGPRMRFHVIYRAPDHFSILVSDWVDGTPMFYCSGRKAILFDPVGPILLYSEDANYRFDFSVANGKLTYNYRCLTKANLEQSKIFVDLKSLVSKESLGFKDLEFHDRVEKIFPGKYQLTRDFLVDQQIRFEVDLAENCPMTSVSLGDRKSTSLRLDKIRLNHRIEDASFAFPSKRQLSRKVAITDVTNDKEPAQIVEHANVSVRASLIRSLLNQPPSAITRDIPGLPGLDWEQIKKNDAKFSKVLKEFVPDALRAR